MAINVIITGVTGMVGEGVLHECIHHPEVDKILILGRRASGITHPKVTEMIHGNFHDLTPVESALKGYNACFFCLGVSSVGMKEDEYHRLTYDLTLQVGKTLSRLNPDLVFCYVSGAGTDSTEKGKSMWARVKGKTENHLLKLPFRKAYMFRPGFLIPTKGLRNTLALYKYLEWLIPPVKALFPKFVSSLHQLGQAMITAATKGYPKSILEVVDIQLLSKK